MGTDPHRKASPWPVSGLREIAIDQFFLDMQMENHGRRAVVEACGQFCKKLAAILDVPLVTCARRHETGTLNLFAASAENGLWLEFQQLPERLDGTVVGNGPGASALRWARPIVMRVTEEGFMPWRQAAERERVEVVAAWPIRTPLGTAVLELFGRSEGAVSSAECRILLAELIRRFETVLAGLEQ